MRAYRINLISPSERHAVKLTPELGLLGMCALLVILMISTSISHMISMRGLAADIVLLTAQNNALKEKINVLQTEEKNPDRAAILANALSEILKKKLAWSELFKEMSSIVPDNVWVLKFSTEASGPSGGEWIVKMTASTKAQNLVSQLYSMLEGSYYFRNMQIKTTERVKDLTPELFKMELEGSINNLSVVTANEN